MTRSSERGIDICYLGIAQSSRCLRRGRESERNTGGETWGVISGWKGCLGSICLREEKKKYRQIDGWLRIEKDGHIEIVGKDFGRMVVYSNEDV